MGKKCEICEATSSSEWENCVVCGALLCDECGIECDGCNNIYCIGKCGEDYKDEEHFHFCFKCK